MTHSRILTIAMSLTACLITAESSVAQGQQSARALAMGGSLVANARGIEAVAQNPAGVLRRPSGLELDLLGLSTRVENNSFSLGDYNRFTGADLSDADKQYILGRIPTGGLSLEADATAQMASFWVSTFAVTFSSQAAAKGTLSRDAIELLLYGNSTFDYVNLSGTGGESYLVASAGFTMAQPIAKMAGGSLSAGVTLRYIKGLFVEQITESYGQITTSNTSIDGNARLVARTANAGRGMAADVGLLLEKGHGLSFGASITNLIGNVNWSGNPEEYAVSFSIDSLSLLTAGNDDLIKSQDTTYSIASFSTRLPSILRVGVSKQTGRNLWTAQWEQGLNRVAGTDTRPRLSAGTEVWLASTIPFRAGVSVGGGRGLGLSLGSGLHAGPFYLDMGTGLASGLAPGSAKGLEFALNTGFRF